jgi:hypothetical protein
MFVFCLGRCRSTIDLELVMRMAWPDGDGVAPSESVA